MLIQVDVPEFLISEGAEPNGLELSRAIHGNGGYQQLVNQDCEPMPSLIEPNVVTRPHRIHSPTCCCIER
jgi:hypothetical protein